MSYEASATRSTPMSREETLPAALLLAFAGGYLDTYTWITHGILANAQTANLVFSGCMPRPRDGSRRFTLCRRYSPSSSAW